MSKVPDGVEDRQSLTVVARRVLLDALVALESQSGAITIVGAQAIYLRSAEVQLTVASFTSDADLGLDPDLLASEPLIDSAMTNAGFVRGGVHQAGTWVLTAQVGDVYAAIAVDLLVPESLAPGGRRSVQIPPHDSMSARRVPGLEASVVDHDSLDVVSLDSDVDPRTIRAQVAGPAALLTAKAYKIHERAAAGRPDRLTDKDAGDVIRLMMIDEGPDKVAARFLTLLNDERARVAARTGLDYLDELFGGRTTVGTEMAVSALAGGVDESRIRTLAPAYVRALLHNL